MNKVRLRAGSATLADWRAIYRGACPSVEESCIPAVEASAKAVAEIIDRGKPVYGVNTGFGTLQYSAMEHTRSVNSSIYIDTGLVVVGLDRQPLFTMIDDTSPGQHDTQLCPCNAPLYAELDQPRDHRSCTDNFHLALTELDMAMPFTPASLNLFMQVRIGSGGEILREPPVAKPGDQVTLRADRDIILVLSACPQDVTPINGSDCTPRDILLTFYGGTVT